MTKFLCVMAGYDMHTEKHLSTIQDTLYRSGFTGTQTRDIPHHITLGTFHIDQEAELVASVKSVAGGTKSVFGFFSSYWDIWRLEGAVYCTELKQSLIGFEGELRGQLWLDPSYNHVN